MASKSKTPEPPSQKPRCGCRFHNGIEVPLNAEVKIYKDRECYLSGIDENYRLIKFLDTGKVEKFRL